MQLTAEELAIYGLIDADTYIRLTDALMSGVTDSAARLPRLDRKTRRRIRARAAELWQEARRGSSG
jgi:hypothetical protein